MRAESHKKKGRRREPCSAIANNTIKMTPKTKKIKIKKMETQKWPV